MGPRTEPHHSGSGGRRASPTATIFAVGHGTRPIDELLVLLSGAGVRRLVDVRTAPGSRRNPQFGNDVLAASLEAAGIEYVWRKDLGGFRKPLPETRHTALRARPFQGYADYMDTEEFRAGLQWLIETSRDIPTAIMCAETLWWRCHRRMISDSLVAGGCEVLHLIHEAAGTPHELHPAARVEDGRLVYDVGGQAELGV